MYACINTSSSLGIPSRGNRGDRNGSSFTGNNPAMPNELPDPRVLDQETSLLNMLVNKAVHGSRIVTNLAHPLPDLVGDIVKSTNQDSRGVQGHACRVPKIT